MEKFKEWTNTGHALPEDAIPRDEILADVSVYWFTGTAGSTANLYYESMHSGDWPTPSPVPTGVAVFAEDIAIRRYAERANNIVHWSDFEHGRPLRRARNARPAGPGRPRLLRIPGGLGHVQ